MFTIPKQQFQQYPHKHQTNNNSYSVPPLGLNMSSHVSPYINQTIFIFPISNEKKAIDEIRRIKILSFKEFFSKWQMAKTILRRWGTEGSSLTLHLLPRRLSCSVPVWWVQVKAWTTQTWSCTPAEPVCKHFCLSFWPLSERCLSL